MLLIITLIVCGIILLTLEAMLPGLILGIIGIGCWVGAIVTAYANMGMMAGHLMVLLVIFLSTFGFILWLKYFPRSPVGKIFESRYRIAGQADFHQDLLGKTGTTVSRLAPSGYARIEGRKLDVVASEGYVEPDTEVEVVDVSGNRIVVRRLGSQSSEA